MAVWSLFGVLGQASILLLDIDLSLKFYVIAAIMLVTTLLTCAFVREPSSEHLQLAGGTHVQWRDSARGLFQLRQALLGLAVFFFSGLGVGAVLPYLTLFVQTITHCPEHIAEMQFVYLMLATAVMVLPAGWLCDKVGPKRVLLVAMVLFAVASLAAQWVTTLHQIALILVVAGIGNAAQSAATYPLMTQLVPPEEVGWYTGLQTTALSIAQPFTVVLTGTLIAHGSYRSIFLVCGISMLLALGVLLLISQRRANIEILQRRAAMGWAE